MRARGYIGILLSEDGASSESFFLVYKSTSPLYPHKSDKSDSSRGILDIDGRNGQKATLPDISAHRGVNPPISYLIN